MSEQKSNLESGQGTADNCLQPTTVVTAFLRHQGRVLLLRRSHRVGTYRGRWSAVSGYLEAPTPLLQARTEIREETALPDAEVHLVSPGDPLVIPAPEVSKLWIVHPFLFDIDEPTHVRLDWENIEFRWVTPDKFKDYPTVPKLAEALHACFEP